VTFEIHPDIAKAEAPPSEVYSSQDCFERLRKTAFRNSWQFAADLDQVKVPGQVYPFSFIEGCVDEPLLLTRDTSDQIHCISNVCTHRGALVCEHAGNERYLRCRYHGRRFGLNGSFEHMPEFEGVEGFPSESDSLRSVQFEQWGRLLFCAVEPACPFSEWMEPALAAVPPPTEYVYDASRSRDYLVKANWALYVDNYLEGFHIPFVHAALNEVIDYGTYRTDLFPWGTLQTAYGSDSFDDGFLQLPPDQAQGVAALYYWFFPNLMLNFYPWGLSINVVKPLAADRTKVSFICYVRDPSRLSDGAGAQLDRVEREDESVVEAVQRGVQSGLYNRGRYSTKRETGPHHFHRMLARALSE
jgi:choline monooxygenase